MIYKILKINKFASLFESMAKIASSGEGANYNSFLSMLKISRDQLSPEDFSNWMDDNNLSLKSWYFSPNNDNFLVARDNNFLFVLSKIRLTPENLEGLSEEQEDNNPLYKAISNFTMNKKCKVLDFSLIRGRSPIPDLFLIKVEILKEKRSAPPKLMGMPKKLSFYPWLYEALNYLTDCSVDEASDFLDENEEKISNLVKVFFSRQHPTSLGANVDGCVYQVNDNHVLKIFKSRSAYQKAKEAVKRLHSETRLGRTEAAIHDVGILGEGNFGYEDVTIYYYIMEKMQTMIDLQEEDPELFESINNIRMEISEMVQNDDTLSEIKESIDVDNPNKFLNKTHVRRQVMSVVEDICQSLWYRNADDIDAINPHLGRRNWLDLFVEEIIIKYLTDRLDLAMNNLGISNQGKYKTLRYFDPDLPEEQF